MNSFSVGFPKMFNPIVVRTDNALTAGHHLAKEVNAAATAIEMVTFDHKRSTRRTQ